MVAALKDTTNIINKATSYELRITIKHACRTCMRTLYSLYVMRAFLSKAFV